jgi:hypothetical protein
VTVLDLLPGPDPHPALVAAVRPSARDVLMAVAVLGWLPEERLGPVPVTP